MIETIPNTTGVQRVEYAPEFSVICSVGLAPFHGMIEITFEPVDRLLEFESFERWLKSIALESMTVEDLCRLVLDELRRALGDIPVRVFVRARTTVHAPVGAMIQKGEFRYDV